MIQFMFFVIVSVDIITKGHGYLVGNGGSWRRSGRVVAKTECDRLDLAPEGSAAWDVGGGGTVSPMLVLLLPSRVCS